MAKGSVLLEDVTTLSAHAPNGSVSGHVGPKLTDVRRETCVSSHGGRARHAPIGRGHVSRRGIRRGGAKLDSTVGRLDTVTPADCVTLDTADVCILRHPTSEQCAFSRS